MPSLPVLDLDRSIVALTAILGLYELFPIR